jgi:hypothetical protein
MDNNPHIPKKQMPPHKQMPMPMKKMPMGTDYDQDKK